MSQFVASSLTPTRRAFTSGSVHGSFVEGFVVHVEVTEPSVLLPSNCQRPPWNPFTLSRIWAQQTGSSQGVIKPD
jgi:hypothetical protein